ncbi:MAG: hypothetical protein V3R78_12515 [Thermodesulfobacteriota bacterium]
MNTTENKKKQIEAETIEAELAIAAALEELEAITAIARRAVADTLAAADRLTKAQLAGARVASIRASAEVIAARNNYIDLRAGVEE